MPISREEILMFRNRWLIALGAIATAFILVSADAQARIGGGFSGGSRGTRTFSAPPATPHRAYRRAY
jgi:uracil-DNA glycosylase